MVLINKKPVTLSFKTVSLALAAVSSVVLTLVALAWLLGLPLPGFVAMTSSAAGAAGASAGR